MYISIDWWNEIISNIDRDYLYRIVSYHINLSILGEIDIYYLSIFFGEWEIDNLSIYPNKDR